MRISHIRIENYRNLKNVDVDLENIVALIGENNSGKSNFLRAISIPLASDDNSTSKRLSWYDINKDSKKCYYNFLKDNQKSIIDSSINIDEFISHVPVIKIQLTFLPGKTEHYDVNDILVHENENEWNGGILYQFKIKHPEELLSRVKSILGKEEYNEDIQMSLLPMELYDYSITVPYKDNKVSYDTLSKFRSVCLPAERDSFASNGDKLGFKALSDLLQKDMSTDSQMKIEKAYRVFFNSVKKEGNLDTILNWQEFSDIENAKDFFGQISILPNMPPMSSIINSIRLGYEEENMFMQGLGLRNLVLLTVLLNSYVTVNKDISLRLLTVEEPEAHLCINNILLMVSLFQKFCQNNEHTQIIYSTHNVEFLNKIGLDKVIVIHNGTAYSLKEELTDVERDYLAANPNTDIFKLLFSKKTILVEGLTEELLIKSYLQQRADLNEIKVLSFHKGFTKIINIWKKINQKSGNKLGIVRDYDNELKAQKMHEDKVDEFVNIKTTRGYTLETDITNANYNLLKSKYGQDYGWDTLTEAELQNDWREKKSDVMLHICHDIVNGELDEFVMPKHIQEIIDFLQGV